MFLSHLHSVKVPRNPVILCGQRLKNPLLSIPVVHDFSNSFASGGYSGKWFDRFAGISVSMARWVSKPGKTKRAAEQ